MNPNTSVPQVTVRWSPQEVHGMYASAFRDLVAERKEAGDLVAARELERMASQSEAGLDTARTAWEAEFGEARHQAVEAEVDREAER
jgi:hypothetical protein